jgi:hypothetical protein
MLNKSRTTLRDLFQGQTAASSTLPAFSDSIGSGDNSPASVMRLQLIPVSTTQILRRP